jgi:hypothetical protein
MYSIQALRGYEAMKAGLRVVNADLISSLFSVTISHMNARSRQMTNTKSLIHLSAMYIPKNGKV